MMMNKFERRRQLPVSGKQYCGSSYQAITRDKIGIASHDSESGQRRIDAAYPDLTGSMRNLGPFPNH